MVVIISGWLGPASSEFRKSHYKEPYKAVKYECETKRVLPESDDIFNVFAFTLPVDVKAAILGQDPYHNYGQAHGPCFSVESNVDIPLLLMNIYRELHGDLGCYIPSNGCLKKWVDQGVMLLDTVSTIRAHQANSHRNIGWEKLVGATISILNQQGRSMVFILWGRSVQAKRTMLNNPRHLTLEAPHPSPLSVSGGLFGSRPSSRTSAFLVEHGPTPVGWQTENV